MKRTKVCMYKVICSSIIWSNENWKQSMIFQNTLVKQIMAHQINKMLLAIKIESVELKLIRLQEILNNPYVHMNKYQKETWIIVIAQHYNRWTFKNSIYIVVKIILKNPTPFARSSEDHHTFQKNKGTEIKQTGQRRVNKPGKRPFLSALFLAKKMSTQTPGGKSSFSVKNYPETT